VYSRVTIYCETYLPHLEEGGGHETLFSLTVLIMTKSDPQSETRERPTLSSATLLAKLYDR
jgi:hypothetical protein